MVFCQNDDEPLCHNGIGKLFAKNDDEPLCHNGIGKSALHTYTREGGVVPSARALARAAGGVLEGRN